VIRRAAETARQNVSVFVGNDCFRVALPAVNAKKDFGF